MGLMTLSGVVGTFLVCAPTYNKPAHRRMRAATLATLGLVAVFPFVHTTFRYGLAEASQSVSMRWIGLEIFAYLCGVIIYVERWPESLFPRRLDLVAYRYRHFESAGSCGPWTSLQST